MGRELEKEELVLIFTKSLRVHIDPKLSENYPAASKIWNK